MNNPVIYVPAQFAEDASELACKYAGGCTTIPGAKGLWMPSEALTKDDVVEDDITLVQVFESGNLARDAIIGRLFTGGEDAVCYTTNGVPSIVESVEWAEAA